MTRLRSAQAVIQAVLRDTNLLLTGKRVAIAGDAPPGLAARLRAMGAHPGSPIGEADLVFGEAVQPSEVKAGAIVAGNVRRGGPGGGHGGGQGGGHGGGLGTGAERIAWARRFMPVLGALAGDLRLDGARIGLVLVLEPKTAVLALTLRDAGAEVTVHCPGRETDDDVAAALAREGVGVLAKRGTTRAEDDDLARRMLDQGLDLLVDDGSRVIRLAHAEDRLGPIRGAAEETTSGLRPLRVMRERGELRVPVMAVNDARSKVLFDNVYGTGQSCVMAALDLTGLELDGAVVAVAGYGHVGQGVARYAAALGADVVVSEVEPFAALRAHHDGHRVLPLVRACAEADLVFSATGIAHTITAGHLAAMRPGTYVAVAGGVRDEVELPAPGHVTVLADGECVNCAAAEGNPVEIMDLSLSVQALAVEHLLHHDLPPAVHLLPEALDERVARLKLAALGLDLDRATEQQRAFLGSGL
ncbi:adenosylhomocysteinase [Nonomuraea sp. NBC_01738]|uniref:adenosylhomocysteinase n=1 Tax=Nonomuraea sp. NBC_01738 TaxID=2976003 RepID=UPI002E0E3477|nr:adenosylhomocysteinase [Nonomuraea sp. NBC_01738]